MVCIGRRRGAPDMVQYRSGKKWGVVKVLALGLLSKMFQTHIGIQWERHASQWHIML